MQPSLFAPRARKAAVCTVRIGMVRDFVPFIEFRGVIFQGLFFTFGEKARFEQQVSCGSVQCWGFVSLFGDWLCRLLSATYWFLVVPRLWDCIDFSENALDWLCEYRISNQSL